MQMESIVVYHAPKPKKNTVAVCHADYQFFLSYTDPDFITDQSLYWFAENVDTIRNRAEWWRDEHDEKRKLILKCEIPAHSTVDQVGIYKDVKAENVVVVERMWYDK